MDKRNTDMEDASDTKKLPYVVATLSAVVIGIFSLPSPFHNTNTLESKLNNKPITLLDESEVTPNNNLELLAVTKTDFHQYEIPQTYSSSIPNLDYKTK